MKKVKCMIMAAALLGLCAGCGSSNVNTGVVTAEEMEAAKNEMGEEIESLEFFLNGEIYQYPMKVQDMMDAGWWIEKNVQKEIATIPANTVTTSIQILNGKGEYNAAKCYITVKNSTGIDIDLGNISLNTLEISKENKATLILPQGITWDSTFEEVVEAYQPSEDRIADSSDYIAIIFTNPDNHKHVMLRFDVATRTLSYVKFY